MTTWVSVEYSVPLFGSSYLGTRWKRLLKYPLCSMQNSPQEKFRCNFRLDNRTTASIIDKRVVFRANEKAQYSHVSLSSKWHFHVLAQFLVAKKGGGDIGQKRERVVSMESFHKFSSHEISRACWYYLSKDKLQITAPNSTKNQRYGPYKTPKWLKFRVSLGCKESNTHLVRVITTSRISIVR